MLTGSAPKRKRRPHRAPTSVPAGMLPMRSGDWRRETEERMPRREADARTSPRAS